MHMSYFGHIDKDLSYFNQSGKVRSMDLFDGIPKHQMAL